MSNIGPRKAQNGTKPYRFDVCWDDSSDNANWDGFVESCADGHHEQTSLWGKVRSQFGWQVIRLIVRDGTRIVAGVQLMTRSAGRLGKIGYVTYGPVFGEQDPELFTLVIRELQSQAKVIGHRCLVLGLPYEGHALPPVLKEAGFFPKPTHFPPSFLEATCVIDLTRSEEEILSRMRPNTRRNIRFSAKQGIRVIEGSAADLSTFRRLMVSLCERRHTTANPPQADFFPQLWQEFQPKGWIKLFLAMKGDEAVSAALAFPFGEYVRVWKVGWSGEFSQQKPNEALWWAAIQWAKKNSYRYLDFVEVDAAFARARSGGGSVEAGPMNVTSFKLGFGGEIKLLPGAYFYFPNLVVRTALRCGLMRVLSTPFFANLTKSAVTHTLGRFSK